MITHYPLPIASGKQAVVLLEQKLLIEEDHRLRRVAAVVFLVEMFLGAMLYFMEPPERPSDFFDKIAPERVAKLVVAPPGKPETDNLTEGKAAGTSKTEEAGKKKEKTKSTGGGGDPRAKITAKGVIGLISGKAVGTLGVTDMAAGIIGAGGITADIDQLIASVGGLKTGGTAGSSRRGKTGIGYGDGYASGFGGGSGGTLDELISQMKGDGALGAISLIKRGSIMISTGLSQIAEGSTGERDMDEIRAVVMSRIGGIKYAYNTMLKARPGLKGKITVEFTINASGQVTNVRVMHSNMNCPELEQKLVRIVYRWKFRPIDQGDVKVIYPFIFSPGD